MQYLENTVKLSAVKKKRKKVRPKYKHLMYNSDGIEDQWNKIKNFSSGVGTDSYLYCTQKLISGRLWKAEK